MCVVLNEEWQHNTIDACTDLSWELCRHFYAVVGWDNSSLVYRFSSCCGIVAYGC